MTDAIIQELHMYYSNAVTIAQSWHHERNSFGNILHWLLMYDISACLFCKPEAAGSQGQYKHRRHSVPPSIKEAVKPLCEE
jgi:hypothetical protein